MAFIISGSLINAFSTNNAAGKAADAQKQAAQTAADTQLQMYNQTRDDQEIGRAHV